MYLSGSRYFIMQRPVLLIALCLMIITTVTFTSHLSHAERPRTKKALQKVEAGEENEELPQPSRTSVASIARDPYLGAILVDAATGKVLFEENADARGYPASIVKLMTLLIILQEVQAKTISLQDTVTVTAAAAKIGGSQVYLKEHETFTVDDLLYALIVQSANDAAVALALHIAGTTDAFVEMMNRKAQELGMTGTVFHSVHGLPPGKGQQPDVMTPRDIVKLCRELLKYPDALRYTATRERPFRADTPQPFIMRTHNHLLGSFEGCDGFKTGYFRAAGFSIAATATKKGARVIAVVMGCTDRKKRDAKARELLARGLAELVRNQPPAQPIKAVPPLRPQPQTESQLAEGPQAQQPDNRTQPDTMLHIPKRVLWQSLIAGGILVLLFLVVSLFRNVKRKSKL